MIKSIPTASKIKIVGHLLMIIGSGTMVVSGSQARSMEEMAALVITLAAAIVGLCIMGIGYELEQKESQTIKAR